MNKKICVFCSSSDAVNKTYMEAAEYLGNLLAKNKYTLIYGGAKVGLMGAIARSVHKHKGKVIGVLPKALNVEELAYEEADKLIVTSDLRERKITMEKMADAFITLPGGFGTLEEIFEIISGKQLGIHNKPVVIMNTNFYFEPLLLMFENIFKMNFAKNEYKELYYIADKAQEAINYIKEYTPFVNKMKWF